MPGYSATITSVLASHIFASYAGAPPVKTGWKKEPPVETGWE